MTLSAITRKAYGLPGWLWTSEITTIYHTTRNSKAHLEIGTYCGKSMYVTACAMQGGRLDCVDPLVTWDGLPSTEWIKAVLLSTIKEAYADSKTDIRFYQETSLHFFENADITYDTIYIDGEHDYEGVSRDIEIAKHLIKDGGIIFGHDYWPRDAGVMDAVNEFCPGFKVIEGTRIWSWQKY